MVTLVGICPIVPDVSRYNSPMFWRVLPVLFCSAAALAGDGVSPEVLLLARAKAHMSQMLTNLPNYTCLQTIERTQRLFPKKKPSLLDVVRIEVALVDGKELFSWPGSGKFVDTELSDMIRGGAIGTGSFGLHAKAVFQGNSAVYHYEGIEERNGRKAHVWSFQVPQMRSGFTLRAGPREAVVGYSGKFWIEAATMDAVRLEVHGDEIPPYLRISAASDAIEYERVPIGAEHYLLPSLAELRMSDLVGNENINRTVFSKCRQYSGESRLLIDEPDAATEPKPPEPEHVYDAPKGLSLELELTAAVPLKSAAVGDPVTAALQNNVKIASDVVLPKGALVHGRLTLIRPTFFGRQSAIAIGMKFSEAEAPGMRVKLNAEFDYLRAVTPEYLNRPSFPQLGNTRPENATMFGSIIFVRDTTSQLRRGLRMAWHTTPLETEDQK